MRRLYHSYTPNHTSMILRAASRNLSHPTPSWGETQEARGLGLQNTKRSQQGKSRRPISKRIFHNDRHTNFDYSISYLPVTIDSHKIHTTNLRLRCYLDGTHVFSIPLLHPQSHKYELEGLIYATLAIIALLSYSLLRGDSRGKRVSVAVRKTALFTPQGSFDSIMSIESKSPLSPIKKAGYGKYEYREIGDIGTPLPTSLAGA